MRGIEDLRSDYVTKQAASFADRQAERHLAQARKVHVLQLLIHFAGTPEHDCEASFCGFFNIFISCYGMQVCETLDRRKGITENVMWPVEPGSDGDEKDEDAVEEGSWELLPAAEKLSDVLTCLRARHFYCLFCGCQVIL